MDIDERLIKEVRKRPIIYDLAHTDYKNVKIKESTWREVARNMKLDEIQCKRRWKGLRDTYKRCKKMEVISSGSDGLPKRQWRYKYMMAFLDDVTSSRNNRTVIENSEDSLFKDPLNFNSVDSTLSNNVQTIVPQPQTIVPQPQTPTSSPPMKKENSREKLGEFLDFAASSISQVCASFVEQRTEQDSTAMHFACLATKIKEANLPMNLVNQIEAKVSELVFSEMEKYQHFSDDQTDPAEESAREETFEWTEEHDHLSPKVEFNNF